MIKHSLYYLLQLMQLLQIQVTYSCYTFKLHFASGFCDKRNICDKCDKCNNRDNCGKIPQDPLSLKPSNPDR